MVGSGISFLLQIKYQRNASSQLGFQTNVLTAILPIDRSRSYRTERIDASENDLYRRESRLFVRSSSNIQEEPSGSPIEHPLIAIGISCGGPASLADIFPHLPKHMPAMLITQHMPAGFTTSFAERLNRMTELNVKEAECGDEVQPDCVFIAPGHSHMTVRRRIKKLVVDLDQGPTACGHRPSVDRLFRSVAEVCGSNCTGIIMTGMGNDGAEAIGEIRRAGGSTIAQDQDSSIVYGMPKAAVQLGQVDRSVALQDIFPTVVEALHVPRHDAVLPTGA